MKRRASLYCLLTLEKYNDCMLNRLLKLGSNVLNPTVDASLNAGELLYKSVFLGVQARGGMGTTCYKVTRFTSPAELWKPIVFLLIILPLLLFHYSSPPKSPTTA